MRRGRRRSAQAALRIALSPRRAPRPGRILHARLAGRTRSRPSRIFRPVRRPPARSDLRFRHVSAGRLAPLARRADKIAQRAPAHHNARAKEKFGGPALVANELVPPYAPVAGFDLHPLAVASARANYLLAVADLIAAEEFVEVPVYARDAVLDPWPAPPSFDFVVGNPPWIAWDNLPGDYREATKPHWQRYGLFSLSGNDARHGGGKKDLSMLVLYAAADRYLRDGGRLGMVITQTLFQSKGAGDGFRRFQHRRRRTAGRPARGRHGGCPAVRRGQLDQRHRSAKRRADARIRCRM